VLERGHRATTVLVAVAAAALACSSAGGAGAAAQSLRGTITDATFRSAALDGREGYSVYLPPGYGMSRTRYPVIYYLHGLPSSAGSYRDLKPIAEAVEQSGREAIVVGVQGARDGDTDPEWRNWGRGRDWETATAVELVHVIDQRFRTIASRAGRVILGISAGGYGATLIADHHPSVFSVIQSWSGYFQATNPAGTAVLDLGSKSADDWADFSKQIPRLRTQFGASLRSTYYSFYVGNDDTRFLQTNEEIAGELHAYGVPNITFSVYAGGHSWTLWGRHASDWIARALQHAAKPSP